MFVRITCIINNKKIYILSPAASQKDHKNEVVIQSFHTLTILQSYNPTIHFLLIPTNTNTHKGHNTFKKTSSLVHNFNGKIGVKIFFIYFFFPNHNLLSVYCSFLLLLLLPLLPSLPLLSAVVEG